MLIQKGLSNTLFFTFKKAEKLLSRKSHNNWVVTIAAITLGLFK